MTVATEIDGLRDDVAAARKDFGEGLARLEGTLNAYILAHTAAHTAEQAGFAKHLLDVAPMTAEMLGPPKLADRVRRLEDSDLATATAFRTLKGLLVVVTGGSLLSAAGFLVMVWRLMNP